MRSVSHIGLRILHIMHIIMHTHTMRFFVMRTHITHTGYAYNAYCAYCYAYY